MHMLILGNEPKTLVNFRGPLVEAMLAAGHRVTAAACGDDSSANAWFRARGVAYHDVPIERAGLNPLSDWRTYGALRRLMRELRPDLLFAYTIKPVIYGLLAARAAGVARRTAMISGLGYAFSDDPGEGTAASVKRRVVKTAAQLAYGAALRFADTVLFQNPDDRDVFASLGLTSGRQNVVVVNGSGVDISRFKPAPMPDGPVTFLMIARLLRDKGVRQFVEAARLVKRRHPEARFVLVGPFDPNPAAITPAEVEAWVREGTIIYGGAVDDVRPHIAACHVFVLPSYYGEGIPRTILEAMAMARPIITTDWRGCREAVQHGVNGLLTPVRDAATLSDAAVALAEDCNMRDRMAANSQQIIRARFAAESVSRLTLDSIAGRAELFA